MFEFHFLNWTLLIVNMVKPNLNAGICTSKNVNTCMFFLVMNNTNMHTNINSKLVFWCNSKRLFLINRAHCVKGTYILYPPHEYLHLRRRQGLPIRFYHFCFWYCYPSNIPDPSSLFLWSSSMCLLVFKACSFSGRGHSKDLLSMFSTSGQSTWPNYFHCLSLISTFVSAIPVHEPLCLLYPSLQFNTQYLP